ncbi:MAG: ankyrin repeat domain-containing protein [Gemmatimonadaceae bacterium]
MRRSPLIRSSLPLIAIVAMVGLAACSALAHADRTGPRLTCSDDPSESPNAWIDPTKGKSASDVFPDPKAAALAKAVAKGDTTQMLALLRGGANPNATGMGGSTLLEWALRRDSRRGFDILLDAGAKPTIFDNDDDNAVRLAAIANDSAYLALLLAHHLDPNVATRSDSTPPLSAALLPRCDKQIRMLLAAKGIDLERADIVGDTPLIVATTYNDFHHVLFLLEAGANPRAHDTHGHTFQVFLNMTPVGVRSKETKASIAEIDAWLTAHHVALETPAQ